VYRGKTPLFFAEVKVTDPLRENQRKHFVRIHQKLKLRTKVYRLVVT